MIDLIILAILSILFGIKFQIHYYLAAGAGFVTGFLFGGMSILFNIIPSAVIVFGFPLTYAFSSSTPIDLAYFVTNSGALMGGYIAGSMLSIIFMPFKMLGKVFKTLFKII